MNIHEIFLDSIHLKKIVKIKFDSKEKGIIERHCIPYDFGPSNKYKDGLDRYHFKDLDSPDIKHPLSILTEQLIYIEHTEEYFNPGDYVNWKPNWIYIRDWGIYS